MLAVLLAALALPAPADSILLRVLSIGDFHGALESRVYRWSDGRPVGGVAALKGLMDSLEAECGCPTLRLDAGDQMQGTLGSNLVHGRSAIEALNLLGLDAAVIGNHDLDWGIDTLRARMTEARYLWIAANIVDSTTGRRLDWARPSAVIPAGPWRIGLVGYANAGTKQIVMAEHVAGLGFPKGRAAIADQLERLREEGVDLTILLAHEGAFCDTLACQGEIMDLARELDSSEVQLIVAGHTHTLVNTVVNGIPVVSARANSTALGVADLVRGADGARRWVVRVEDVYADAIRPDSAAVALVARYEPETERRRREVMATLADSLTTVGSEYPLGHLIADAQRAAGRADVALMNNGGIRRDLFPGPVTYADLFELHPFGNVVVTVTVSAAQLREILEHTLRRGRPSYHVSGLTVRYDPRRPAGRRVIAMLGPDGQPIDTTRSYRLALSNFLAGGGDGMPVVPRLRQQSTDQTDLDAVAAHLRSLPQPVRAPTGRRYLPIDR